jgi:hypothetical protein
MPGTQCLSPELCAREFRDLKEDINKLTKSLDDLRHVLTVSNGGPCVVEQVHGTVKDLDDHKKWTQESFRDIAERKMIAKKWALGIISAIVIQMIIVSAIYVKQSNVLATLILSNHELIQQNIADQMDKGKP